ncbi:MAG: efflux RND transporter permease subunit [Gammaproteobacteria bacterium]|nr:efflux RND transporter permease subunit [Gammaproteobacteria bacterium]
MHAIISAAFDRSRTVLMLLVFLIAAGIVAYNNIPKESEPDVPIPIMYVSMSHDGISPEDAERLLVRPMEKELQSLTGVKEMRSTASEGHASVLLEFDAGFDGDQALLDVREKVDAAKSKLPADTDEPTVNEINIALFPVLNISLSGPIPERTLIKIARELKDSLEALPGVLEADIAGEREEVLEIEVDPNIMETYQVDFNSLFQLISNNNLLVAAGAIDTGAGRMVLKVPGIIENIEDVMNMPVKVTDDAVVVFRDVANIRRTFKDPHSFARLDGQPTLVLEISKRLGANIIETIDDVRATIEAKKDLLPSNLEIGFHQDKSKQTKEMLGDLQNNVVSGVILVMIVIMAALGVRSSILVGFAIPGSFLTGILVIYAMGHTMNVIVLFSLILVVGMLVDGAIIVSELADRNLSQGMSKADAYANASKRMAWPIIASTFTTLAVFAPLLFWPGLIGQFMRYMPITVIACLIASLAMALVFIPVIGKIIGRKPDIAVATDKDSSNPKRAQLQRVLANPDRSNETSNIVAQDILDASSSGARGRYLKVLHKLLRYPSITLIAVLLFTVLSYVVYGVFGKGVEFFPDIEPESLIAKVHARGDLSIYEQDKILTRVENLLIGNDAFKSVYTRTGNDSQDEGGDVIGNISLELKDWNKREKAVHLIADMEKMVADIAGVQIEFLKNEGGPGGGGKPINIQVSASSLQKTYEAVDYIRNQMTKLGGFAGIEDNRPLPGIEWRLNVDRQLAAQYGANIALIGNAIQLITSGIRVAGYRPDDATDELDIRIRYPIAQRDLDQISELRVLTNQGMVPISNFVSLSPAPKTGVINRIDGKRVITIQSDVAEGFLPDTQKKELEKQLMAGPVDPEVSVKFKGEAEEQQEAAVFLITAFISAIFFMMIILVTQFNSLYQAILVLSAILFSTSGVLIGLLVTGQTFGIVMVGIGIIALAGIVVNNNIVLIDTYNKFRQAGSSAFDAAMLTGSVRARPVFLTALTTILGLMPMVLSMNINFFSREISFGAPSTQWWTQLASAIAGGLAFTTLLTLFLTPCLLVLGAKVSAARTIRKHKPRMRALAGKSAPSGA